jgi:hypothetical protein
MPLSAYFDNRKSWYVSGAIHYRDQFQGTQERISKFCFRIIATKDFKTDTMRPGYDACPHWNCIDEKACANDRARYRNWVAEFLRPSPKSEVAPPLGPHLG